MEPAEQRGPYVMRIAGGRYQWGLVCVSAPPAMPVLIPVGEAATIEAACAAAGIEPPPR